MLKIYREPVVILVAEPNFYGADHLAVETAGMADDGSLLAEYAGRICYMSQANPKRRTTAEYIENIITQGHGSVLEHAQYSFLLEGISRSCSHELVRHRAGTAVSQLSQRYVDASDTAFVMHPTIQGVPELEAQFESDMAAARDRYEQVAQLLEATLPETVTGTLRRKRAREAARTWLPNATETKIVWSANLRALRHIIALRIDASADLEIQALARELLSQMRVHAPAAFFDFVTDTTGTHPLHHKV